ncbi:unnamed protein product [Paramecium octaurelia]|uniref:26 kDa periplasmic immunogenic protein n=1 Tax=Paramecium octaurelia TaxID=43137 RepID=A0A8S1X753_PAROT|nr:unnamed protein product [Paramecium octaurelia]
MITILSLSFLISITYSQFLRPTEDAKVVINSCGIQEYLLPYIYYVQGSASTIMEPTQATITLNIQVKNVQAQEALQQLADISDRAIKAIKEQSSSDLKIQTNDYQIQPYTEYDFTVNPASLIFKGFKANSQLTIETLNISEVGKIIDIAVKNGVETVAGVSFDISKEQKRKIKDNLVEHAIEDASHTADVVLKEINMKIVSVKSVVLNEGYGYDQGDILQQTVTVGYVIAPIDQ